MDSLSYISIDLEYIRFVGNIRFGFIIIRNTGMTVWFWFTSQGRPWCRVCTCTNSLDANRGGLNLTKNK